MANVVRRTRFTDWRLARPPVERWRPGVLLVGVIFVVVLGGCDQVREVASDLFDHRPARERYEASLQGAGLDRTALVRDWMTAGQRALRNAPVIASPHREEGYLPPAEPTAIAFRVMLRRGQEVAFRFDMVGDTGTLVFLDGWQVETEGEVGLQRVISADSGDRILTYEPRRDGEFVFRAQPELLRGGRFTAALNVGPTLAFPVQQRRERDIGSKFGAPRDAGARSHHGIDIFAPRGTPAVAAAAGTVTRVQTTEIGGNVVWMRDERGNSLYYAHLDRQVVTAGEHVRPGDTLGFVGNTGNARTTPPHLHFGVYRRGQGPVDPFWFVHEPGGRVPALAADTSLLGNWARTTAARTIVRSAPNVTADTAAILLRHSVVRVLTAVGGTYRVALADGTTGYLASRSTEPAERPISRMELRGSSELMARPLADPSGDFVVSVGTTRQAEVLGRFGHFAYVRVGGVEGWIAQ